MPLFMLPVLFTLLAFIQVFLGYQEARAFVQHEEVDQKTLTHKSVLRPQLNSEQKASFKSAFVSDIRVQKDQNTQAVRVLWGKFGAHPQLHSKADFLSFAEHYITQNYPMFGVRFSDLKLNEGALYLDDDVQFIKFKVYRQGVWVKDAGIDLRFKKGHLVQVINQTFAEAVIASDRGLNVDAEELASTGIQAPHSLKRLADVYRVDEQGKGYVLSKVAQFQARTEQGGSYSIEVDVGAGKIRQINDNFLYLQGKATGDVHARWYNEGLSRSGFDALSVKTNTGSLFTGENGTFTAEADANPSLAGLTGKYVKIHDMGGHPIQRLGVNSDNFWNIYVDKTGTDSIWLDKNIAQSMIYYHTTKMVQYAKKYIDMPWLNQPLLANANLSSFCNAHWDGNSINLYSGNEQCANTALISDVIYHEWGHGLHHNSEGIEDGALSEGFGDIMSLLMTRSHVLGIGFRVPDHSPVRDLEATRRYPEDRGEVHAEGLIIGSTFWDLYKALGMKHGEDAGVDLLSKYAFKMIFTSRTYLDVYHSLLVIDDNDTDLSNGTPNGCLLNTVFVKHGLATVDANCSLASIDVFEVTDPNHSGVLNPGDDITVRMKAKNQTSHELTQLRGEFTVTDPKISVEKSSFYWGSIPVGQSLFSDTSVVFHIADDMACGTNFMGKIQLKADNNEVLLDREFTVGKNEGQAQTYAATGLPMDVNDMSTTRVPVQVDSASWNDTDTVFKAQLKFDISHSYVGDVVVNLVSPDGQSKPIYKGKGNSRDVHFNQDITALLSGVKGKGKWELLVKDTAAQDEGSVESVELTLTPSKFICQ